MIGTTRRSSMLAAPAALTLAALLVGCSGGGSAGGSGGTTAQGSSAPPSTGSTVTRSPEAYETPTGSATEQPDRTVEVSVSGRKVTPSPGKVQVKAGDDVRIVVTSDVANMVHVHGADVEKKVPAGTPTTLDVTMDQTGVFEVEMHDPALLLFQFVVR